LVFDVGVITLKLDDTIERRLRQRAAQLYGLTRGGLSRSVEDALTSWLRSAPSIEGARVRYFAFLRGKLLLEAPSLRELAKGLKKAEIDPRDVEIRTAPPAPRVEKLGLRLSHRAE
jgi:hypothetical protein